ncbi:hypothetical protein EYB31_13345 [Paenibacillus thalictri]|uniref:Uncharacterized protein n=1 Tax=Paenibacillus thalictri TaxID=2527873 RepID=A0A4Q9DQ14_9BACL|nr:hypothetical protein EYB31_13345 [Paenibacillus thalictri]
MEGTHRLGQTCHFFINLVSDDELRQLHDDIAGAASLLTERTMKSAACAADMPSAYVGTPLPLKPSLVDVTFGHK